MGRYFKNEEGQDVGLCPTCNKIKPKLYLQAHRTIGPDFFTQCIECRRAATTKALREGQMIRNLLYERAGGCVWPDCHLRYPRDFVGTFCLDHINPSLKKGSYETNAMWITHNEEEFWTRVVPNLQVLCVHHNQVKRAQQYGVGGEMHIEPWDQDEEDIPHIDFNEIKLVLPGFEEYANPLT